MKKVLPIFLLLVLLLTIWKIDEITDVSSKVVSASFDVKLDPANEYAGNYDYIFVQNTDKFIPYSKQDIINILYTGLDNGYDTFTFYCPSEYAECLNDIDEITDSETIPTDIGNFVHPYNSFMEFSVRMEALGEVDIVVKKMYTPEMIERLNAKYDEMFNEIITDEMDIYDKILAVHDYIIENVSYKLEDDEKPGDAYEALIEGKSKCSGYADAMAIALSKLGVQNYKVSSAEHVWNALYLDGEWSQIDLTWDDPIVESGATITDTIRHKFFMIDTETLYSYNTLEHNFDDKVYVELRK